jgi:hypothetical protein
MNTRSGKRFSHWRLAQLPTRRVIAPTASTSTRAAAKPKDRKRRSARVNADARAAVDRYTGEKMRHYVPIEKR